MTDKMREEFEFSARKIYCGYSFSRFDDGGYIDSGIDDAWIGWQACAKQKEVEPFSSEDWDKLTADFARVAKENAELRAGLIAAKKSCLEQFAIIADIARSPYNSSEHTYIARLENIYDLATNLTPPATD